MTTIQTIQSVPTPMPRASISTTTGEHPDDMALGVDATPDDEPGEDGPVPKSLIRLYQWATARGDISDLLSDGEVERLGADAIRQWESDSGTRSRWVEDAERFLSLAAQEGSNEDGPKDYPFEGAADIHYPLLTTAMDQFAARAMPELVKGDKVVGVKVFAPPSQSQMGHSAGPPMQAPMAGPDPSQMAPGAGPPTPPMQAGPPPPDPAEQVRVEREARAERVKHYLNWLIFYRMDDWEGDTDLLLHQLPCIGRGFKKVYMGPEGLRSELVTALRLTVAMETRSLVRCPRITQDFELYPYEIEDNRRAGIFRDVELPSIGDDPEQPRKMIEQHRLDDLDGDGLAEPYVVTVDVESRTVMRVEAAYGEDDIIINDLTNRVIRIERWNPFCGFLFLPDPKGGFYGTGLGRLLDTITDSVDASINQLIDAGNAEIAGGGFIGSGVRLQGSGQGGSVFFRPGEYQTVSAPGQDLRQAIWERTVPHPSAVTMQMLEMLLAAAKDIASVKDVITGNSPATAPVGTTLALQNQALQVFSSIYKRVYRGFKDEFHAMYQCLKRFGTDRERREYQELTGGDFDQDFSGDGTDIQPVADPSVVTKMQKLSRLQTLMQVAESPIGQAAGMQQPGPAQAIVGEALEIMDWDRPERFTAPVAPNPMMVAKVQETQAQAALKQADAVERGAATTLKHAQALKIAGEAAEDSHGLHDAAAAMFANPAVPQMQGDANAPGVAPAQ